MGILRFAAEHPHEISARAASAEQHDKANRSK